MNDKEASELRRHLRLEHHCISKIFGLYVTGTGEKMAQFVLPMSQLGQEEQEYYLNLLKKTVSGSMNRSLKDIVFTTKQVADSDEHRLLMRLLETGLEDETALAQLYDKITATVQGEDNYLILSAVDQYDVPHRAKDSAALEDGEEVYTYLLTCICPVRQSKTQLSYCPEHREFHPLPGAYQASAPELGFLFPAFDGRHTNLYGALYYCRNPKADYSEFVTELFHVEPPMPVETQKETFASLLSHSLEEECSLQVVQSVQEQLGELMEAHKQSREPEPLTISGNEVRALLSECGVSQTHQAAFSQECEAKFGPDAVLSPRNLMDSKKMQLRTPDVVISVNAERSDLIQTRTIGGVNYILICADEGVEVNGIDIQLPK